MTIESKDASAVNAAVALRVLAAVCFASGLIEMDWSRGHASQTAIVAIAFGLPYLFVLGHPGRWRSQAIGVALGFPLAAIPFALLLRTLAWSNGQSRPLTFFVVMNMVVLVAAAVVWIADRARLRVVVVISFALCAWLLYIPLLLTRP